MRSRSERRVPSHRLRQLVLLVGEASEIRGDLEARRAHLVQGAARLVGAAFVATVVDRDFVPGGRGRLDSMAAHGLDGASTDVLTVLAERGTAFHPALRRSMGID